MNIGFQRTNETPSGPITSLSDSRLVLINPQAEGFFDDVINFSTDDEDIYLFVEAIKEVKNQKLEAFYRPIYDPSESGDSIVFEKGKRTSVGHTYFWWQNTVSSMHSVEGRHWHIATEYQYYAFLVHLINQKVSTGKSISEALYDVVKDSVTCGHYIDSENSKNGFEFEKTGSRWVCGFYDLANACKILSSSSNEDYEFWIASGYYQVHANNVPLAALFNFRGASSADFKYSTALLVL